MKKKFSFLAAIFLIAKSACAAVTTTAYIDPMYRVTYYYPGTIYSHYTYNIINDSNTNQVVSICMTTDICYEGPNPDEYHKTLHSCDNYTLKPGESKTRDFNTILPFSYHFYGSCDTKAVIEVSGWQHSISTAYGKLFVSPN